MGAALTYARRYALFTLVGIAGEDDLDAPNLCAGSNAPSSTAPERAVQPDDGNSPGQSRGAGNGRGRGSTKSGPRVILDPAQSAELRDKLLIEVESIASADLATTWAGEALVAKNSLTAADVKLVEDAFERRLSELPSSEEATSLNDHPSVPQIGRPQVIATAESADAGQAKGIDKSILAVATPRRYPNRRVSCAAASPRTPITSDSRSRARSAARSAMSSRSHSAAGITGRCIAHATSARGGGRPALTRSRLPAGSGRKRAE
jgi:hypothetical protein